MYQHLQPCSPHPNTQELSSPRHNLSRQHTTVESPSHPPQYHHQNDQLISKIEPNTHDQFAFFIRINNKPRALIGQHSWSEWFNEVEETGLLLQNKNQSMIIHKIQGWPQTRKTITTKKLIKTSRVVRQQYKRQQLARTTRTAKDDNKQYTTPYSTVTSVITTNETSSIKCK